MADLDQFAGRLEALSGLAGVIACGVVNAASAEVRLHAGDEALVPGMRAVTESWRAHQQHSAAFPDGGSCRAMVVMHATARFTITPCGRSHLLVSVTSEPDQVLWSLWKRHVAAVTAALLAEDPLA